MGHDRPVRQIVPEKRQGCRAIGDHETDQWPLRVGAHTKRDEARDGDAQMQGNPQIAARIRPESVRGQIRPQTPYVVGVSKRRSEISRMNGQPRCPQSPVSCLHLTAVQARPYSGTCKPCLSSARHADATQLIERHALRHPIFAAWSAAFCTNAPRTRRSNHNPGISVRQRQSVGDGCPARGKACRCLSRVRLGHRNSFGTFPLCHKADTEPALSHVRL
jgi:hypothetical protein